MVIEGLHSNSGNDDMVQSLVDEGCLVKPDIIAAFKSVDRADFVPDIDFDMAYADTALALADGSTISQPMTVARMLGWLKVESGHHVLEIGCGSGYVLALLAHITGSQGSVIGSEINPDLIAYARERLLRYPGLNIAILQARGFLGHPERGPFDRILVSAGLFDAKLRKVERLNELIDQLIIGGFLVIPIEESIWVFEKLQERGGTGKWFDSVEYPGYNFVKLVDGQVKN